MQSLSIKELLTEGTDFHMAVMWDLVFAYMYEARFQNFDDELSESSVANIIHLSQCLAWHVDPKQWSTSDQRAKAFIVSSYRRVLCYGAYRNFDLCQRVHSDVVSLTRSELCQILERLISLFNEQKWAITAYFEPLLLEVQQSEFSWDNFTV